ncbi:MAG: hypothetical protein IKO83_09720 [Oscillospiraceae bacterium]|nr:hypothetical protein [Oscillospiraceae bacterium]
MKTCKKILVIALTLLMLLSLSACGMSDLPLIKAGLGFIQLNSVHIRPEGELAMNIDLPAFGMNMNMAITADGEVDYCADPLSFSADVSLNYMDETMNFLAFGEDRGGEFFLSYSEDGGDTWTETNLGKTADITAKMDKASDFSISDLIDLGKNLGDSFSGFSKGGQEMVGGVSATRYDASFSLRKLMNSKEAREAFFQGMAEAMKVDAAALAEQIDVSALEDLELSLWLEEAGSRIVKVQLDMSDLMHSIIGSGLLDSILASEAGLEGVDFAVDVSSMRLALSFSDFDGVGEISRPTGGSAAGASSAPAEAPAEENAVLQPGDSWLGTITISNHAGQGSVKNGVYDVWAILDTAGGRPYFEIYDAEDAWNGDASPAMSFWAVIDGNRIVPDIDPGEEDAWLINIYLAEEDEDALVFTLNDGTLSASYFYYDGEKREACDLLFALTPET